MRHILTLGLLCLALAGCGAAAPTAVPNTPVPTQPAFAFDTRPEAVVIEKFTGGGFVPALYSALDPLPVFRLYGNGRAIYRYYDPNGGMRWMETTLDQGQVAALVKEVAGPQRELCGKAVIAPAPITDVGVTRIVVELSDETCAVAVDALGIELEGGRPGITPAGQALLDQATRANAAIDQLIAQPGAPFSPASVTLATFADGAENPVAWPFSASDLRDKAEISGPDAAKVLEFASLPVSVKGPAGSVAVIALPKLP